MIAELKNAVRPVFRVSSGVAHVAGRPSRIGSPLVLAILALLVTPVQAIGQTTPEAPALCIEESGNCGSPIPVSAGSKKWNPGHYIKPQGNHAQTDIEKFLTSVTNQLAKTGDSQEIKGSMITYSWGMLEPTLGNYDFAPIYRHLDYLSSRGLKAILSVNTKCFGNDCGSLAPADLQDAVFVTANTKGTLTMALWEEEYMDLYIRLWDALGAEFDNNPAVEMVLGAESTPSLAGGSPDGFTKGGYADQLKRLYSAQVAAFPTTNVIANINFLSGEVSGLLEHAYAVGVGRGMPDIIDSDGSLLFRGECEDKECAVRDYRGSIPHFGVASFQQLTGKFGDYTDSPAETIEYGLENKITHYGWVTNESGEDSWDNIVIAIEAASPDGHTACPTQYAQGCQ
jgi:hypothetical protein